MATLPKRIIKETERLMAEPLVSPTPRTMIVIQRVSDPLAGRILIHCLSRVPGISAVPHEDNLRYFDVKIHGPSQSPYEGQFFAHATIPQLTSKQVVFSSSSSSSRTIIP